MLWSQSRLLGTSYCGPAVPNSSGVGAKLELRGSNVTALQTLTLTVSDMPLHALGYCLAANEAGFVATPGGSQGNLCLGGDGVIRLTGPNQTLDSWIFGAASATIDPSSFLSPSGLIVVPTYGESWHFQAWFRDANPHSTSNFSEGVVVRLY